MEPRDGKTIYRGETWRDPKIGHAPEPIIYQVIERTINAGAVRRVCLALTHHPLVPRHRDSKTVVFQQPVPNKRAFGVSLMT